MKIAWVTPFAARSAIGRVSATVIEALCERNHEVAIIRSEREKLSQALSRSASVPMSWWQDASPQKIYLETDVIVLNFGDNYELHAGTLAFAGAVPCLGVFHDFYLYNFFNRWLVHNGLGEEVHNRETCRVYGEGVVPLATKAWRDEATIEQIATSLPMTEWLGRRCSAALAHSQFYVNRLEASCPGPIAVAPLCFENRDVRPLPKRDGPKIAVTTIGIVNPNKCADRIIKAIGSSAVLKTHCEFRLVGAISDGERARLQALCMDVGFGHLCILGEVDDATLVAELERADIISCLREPVLEGASASAIEGMKSGRPIVVVDSGFYADLPNEFVFKIPAPLEISSLRETLEHLISDEELRRHTGTKARDWALQVFTSRAYVSVFEELSEQFLQAKPLLRMSDRIGQRLAALGVKDDDPAVDRLAHRMRGLFGGNN
jgi:glycosyltransferase involved in cell wall biosynthesis